MSVRNDNRCAPGNKYDNGSCISVDVLIAMAEAYNQKYPHKQIQLSNSLDTLKPNSYKKRLIKEFSNRLSDICEDQTCWVKQDFVNIMKKAQKEELKKNTFRPHGPAGSFKWLSTTDIDSVMEQYENVHKDFDFLGTVPIDFDELPRLGIKNYNFDKKMSNGIHKFGIVFNLDEHYKSGSHWVSLYADLKKGDVHFFDSYGMRPDKRIVALMNRMKNSIKTATKDVRHNKVRHQLKGTECGVYSINFVVRSLKGESFESITNNITRDDKINKCRDVYFRKQ